MTLNFAGVFKEVVLFSLPSIDISLRLPGLSTVVDGFISKGYALADSDLKISKDCITDIDLILGSDSAFCFHASLVHFGASSVYTSSQLGVSLMGAVSQILVDLRHLPSVLNTENIPSKPTQNKVMPSLAESVDTESVLINSFKCSTKIIEPSNIESLKSFYSVVASFYSVSS